MWTAVRMSVTAWFMSTVLAHGPRSPCPDVFQYNLGLDGIWRGQISIPPPPRAPEVTLSVKLSLASALPNKYVGHLSLADTVPENISKSQKQIRYKLLFPLRNPIPTLDKIIVNGEIICQGPRVNAPILTKISLEHNFVSTETDTASPARGNLQGVTTSGPPSDVCGRSVLANELIFNGKRTSRGEWPWIAAIFFSSTLGNLQFQCGGTLINKIYVVTAGHCVKRRDVAGSFSDVDPRELVVYLGMHNLHRVADAFTQAREVKEIHVHPDFQTTSSYDADIAVLQLSYPVVYTRYVRPICLWPFAPDLDGVVGKLGTIVGWGRDEKGQKSTNDPLRTDVPIVSQFDCLRNKTEFVAITSERTFCAGFRNNSGPCNGDSGSGLVLKYNIANVAH